MKSKILVIGLLMLTAFTLTGCTTELQDTEIPFATLSDVSVINISVGESYNLPTCTVTDNVDTDLECVVDFSNVDVDTAGTYVVTYNVTDTEGNAAVELTVNVVVSEPADTEVPVITLSALTDVELIVGGTYTLPTCTVTDNVDTDLECVVDFSNVDVDTAGTYVVTYNVTDTAGNVAVEVTVNVVVKGIPMFGNVPADVELRQDGDLLGLGITVVDHEDGDLTDDITVDLDLSTLELGTNTVRYSVTDTDGNLAYVDVDVYVIPSLINYESKVVFENYVGRLSVKKDSTIETIPNYWTNGIYAYTSIEDDALKFSGLGWDYYKTTIPTVNNKDRGYEYISFSMKGDAGATFESFRFYTLGTTGDASAYVNQGHVILADGTTLTADMLTTDYQEFVIDIAASGLEVATEGISINYGGFGPEHALYVNEISWYDKSEDLPIDYDSKVVFDSYEGRIAVEKVSGDDLPNYWTNGVYSELSIEEDALKFSGEAWSYYKTSAPNNNTVNGYEYLALTIKGDGGFNNFALYTFPTGSTTGSSVYINSGNIKLVGGTTLTTSMLTSEYQTLYIDLAASGLEVNAEGLSLIYGSGSSVFATIYVKEIAFIAGIPGI
jgi:hypothetical protein